MTARLQIGYSLVDETGKEVSAFSQIPDFLQLDALTCVSPVEVGAVYQINTGSEEEPIMKPLRFVEKFLDVSAQQPFHSQTGTSDPVFDGQVVIVTAQYSAAPDIVPAVITPLQVRLALNQAGLRAQVNAYVATLSQDEQDKWEYATTIERTNATLVAGTSALGMSVQQVDQLFQLAVGLL